MRVGLLFITFIFNNFFLFNFLPRWVQRVWMRCPFFRWSIRSKFMWFVGVRYNTDFGLSITIVWFNLDFVISFFIIMIPILMFLMLVLAIFDLISELAFSLNFIDLLLQDLIFHLNLLSFHLQHEKLLLIVWSTLVLIVEL